MCDLYSGSNIVLDFKTRWMMHRTGKYKMMNLTFGFLPFIAALLITFMKPDSPQAQQWLSIVSRALNLVGFVLNLTGQIPLGLGNGIVLQTMLSEGI